MEAPVTMFKFDKAKDEEAYMSQMAASLLSNWPMTEVLTFCDDTLYYIIVYPRSTPKMCGCANCVAAGPAPQAPQGAPSV